MIETDFSSLPRLQRFSADIWPRRTALRLRCVFPSSPHRPRPFVSCSKSGRTDANRVASTLSNDVGHTNNWRSIFADCQHLVRSVKLRPSTSPNSEPWPRRTIFRLLGLMYVLPPSPTTFFADLCHEERFSDCYSCYPRTQNLPLLFVSCSNRPRVFVNCIQQEHRKPRSVRR